jgi:hypothetical protein
MDSLLLPSIFAAAERVLLCLELENPWPDRCVPRREQGDSNERKDNRRSGDRRIRVGRPCSGRRRSDSASERTSMQPSWAYLRHLKLYPQVGTA